jgi:hypothetical protein
VWFPPFPCGIIIIIIIIHPSIHPLIGDHGMAIMAMPWFMMASMNDTCQLWTKGLPL